MTDAERFAVLKRAAWDSGDYDLLDFYSRIEGELKALRLVGAVAGRVYNDPDDFWNALHDAIADAGLLDTGEPE